MVQLVIYGLGDGHARTHMKMISENQEHMSLQKWSNHYSNLALLFTINL